MISLQTALLRLSLALLLGGLIGLERGRGERGAGLRTYALVALGSALTMIVSAFGFSDLQGMPNVTLDPSRVAAQVISGIGFLGAGTILLRKEIVTGLTTAAAIWVVAAIGLACGGGLLLEATATTIFTIFVLMILRPLRYRSARSQYLRIKATVAEEALINRIYDTCIKAEATIENIEIQAGQTREKIEIACKASDALQLAKSIVALRTEPGIESVSVILRSTNNTNAPLSLFAEEYTT